MTTDIKGSIHGPQDGFSINLARAMSSTTMVGPGLRDALWVQGCSLDCPGCANETYKPFIRKTVVPVSQLVKYYKSRINKIDGISLLGGEPTDQLEGVGLLLKEVKDLGLSTVVFTGHTYEKLKSMKRVSILLENTDLLIDGPYLENRKSTFTNWYGSSNQRLIKLSNYFSDQDLLPSGPNGEIIISEKEITFHGVGTQRLKITI